MNCFEFLQFSDSDSAAVNVIYDDTKMNDEVLKSETSYLEQIELSLTRTKKNTRYNDNSTEELRRKESSEKLEIRLVWHENFYVDHYRSQTMFTFPPVTDGILIRIQNYPAFQFQR